jgi:putative transcriptional regulator
MRYASGAMEEAFTTVAAAHLALCPRCRDAAHAGETVGGELLDGVAASELAPGAFDRMMAAVAGDAGEAVSIEAPAQPVRGAVPVPLQRLIGGSLDGIAWRTVSPGVRKFDIPVSSGASLFMLKVAPGRKIPEHGHGGSELTLVLSGSYGDEFGQFERGDVADLDENATHQPQANSPEPCICLVAIEAPTRFKRAISRLLQPFLGV